MTTNDSTTCPRCAGTNGNHGLVHVRHGNGAGHNEPCPNTPPSTPAPAKHPYATVPVGIHGHALAGVPVKHYNAISPRIAAEHRAQSILTKNDWLYAVTTGSEDDDDGGLWTFTPPTGAPLRITVWPSTGEEPARVVARDEPLNPVTHPYRVGEVLEYIGPTLQRTPTGVLRFRRAIGDGTVEMIGIGGSYIVEMADLRRPEANVAVELTPTDVARIFQALSLEAERLYEPGDPDQVMKHVMELRDRFAVLHP